MTGLSSLLSGDPRTRRPVLTIALPESVNRSRIMQATSTLSFVSPACSGVPPG